MDLPPIFAFAPAAFLGLVTIVLTTASLKRSRRPVPAEESLDGGAYSLLLMATLLAWVLFLLFVALGFAFFEVGDMFRGWGTAHD